ncbi:MAG TPA: hypothetical protein VHO69_09820, partial [Phototrophicaceae bacterium]|nr:hypothetical protein [Phototrophicaceae bacterium]
PTPTFWALLVILVIGAFFRVNELSRIPPEMTSDHKEKLLDAQRVLDVNLQVFFPNNGGREPFQMYAMATPLLAAPSFPKSADRFPAHWPPSLRGLAVPAAVAATRPPVCARIARKIPPVLNRQHPPPERGPRYRARPHSRSSPAHRK